MTGAGPNGADITNTVIEALDHTANVATLDALCYTAVTDTLVGHDDYYALTDAISAVNSIGTLILRPGTYSCSKLPSVPRTVTLEDNGAVILLNATPQQRCTYYRPTGQDYTVHGETFFAGVQTATTGSIDVSTDAYSLTGVASTSG